MKLDKKFLTVEQAAEFVNQHNALRSRISQLLALIQETGKDGQYSYLIEDETKLPEYEEHILTARGFTLGAILKYIDPPIMPHRQM